jgi:hypothetical protein
MVLGTIGMLLAAGAIAGAADKRSKKANPNLNNKRFDADCARYGVATSSAGFTSQKIMDIAARCGVRPNKYGVLPEDGWKRCMHYVSNYVNNPGDIAHFERDWRKTVAIQLNGKAEMLIEKHWPDYYHQYQGFLKYPDHWLSGPPLVLELKHWHGLPKEDHLARMKDIQENTFWSELVIGRPVLRHNPRFEDAHIEVWTVRGSKNDKPDSWISKRKKLALYEDCCGVCGYDAML